MNQEELDAQAFAAFEAERKETRKEKIDDIIRRNGDAQRQRKHRDKLVRDSFFKMREKLAKLETDEEKADCENAWFIAWLKLPIIANESPAAQEKRMIAALPDSKWDELCRITGLLFLFATQDGTIDGWCYGYN